MLPSLFGGEEGVTASRTRAGIDFGWPLATQLQVYYAVIAWTVIAALLMYAFTRTPAGRMCNAVRDNAERVEFVGYRAQRIRLIVVAVAGLFAGLAGGLHAINYEIVSADAVSAQRSGSVLIMAYIGGANRFLGPVLGAIVITWLQSSLSDYTSAWLLYLGIFFILVIRYAPSGLAGVIATERALLRTPACGAVLSAYAIALLPVAMIAVGAIVAVEMSYRLSTHAELGTRMRLLGFSIDAGTVWPWAAAAALLGIGLLLFRAIYPSIVRAHDRAAAYASRA
jgi:branched-chain amino acid transport system permease protein